MHNLKKDKPFVLPVTQIAEESDLLGEVYEKRLERQLDVEDHKWLKANGYLDTCMFDGGRRYEIPHLRLVTGSHDKGGSVFSFRFWTATIDVGVARFVISARAPKNAYKYLKEYLTVIGVKLEFTKYGYEVRTVKGRR